MPLTSRERSQGLKTNITKTELWVCEHWSSEPGGSHCTFPSQYTQQRRKRETGYAYRWHKVRLKGSNKAKSTNGEMARRSKNQWDEACRFFHFLIFHPYLPLRGRRFLHPFQFIFIRYITYFLESGGIQKTWPATLNFSPCLSEHLTSRYKTLAGQLPAVTSSATCLKQFHLTNKYWASSLGKGHRTPPHPPPRGGFLLGEGESKGKDPFPAPRSQELSMKIRQGSSNREPLAPGATTPSSSQVLCYGWLMVLKMGI